MNFDPPVVFLTRIEPESLSKTELITLSLLTEQINHQLGFLMMQ